MDHFKHIYSHQADLYDRLVEREDQRGFLFAALMEIAPLSGAKVVDLGTGTGRVTRFMTFVAQAVYAFDLEQGMLAVAQEQLGLSGYSNWYLAQADNERIPLPDQSVDIVIEGWSFAHTRAWFPDDWQLRIGNMIDEMKRVLKPGGTLILIETMGTGNRQPEPPSEHLAELYAWWEATYGLNYRWVRTDYQFESPAEAYELTQFFFGDELAEQFQNSKQTLLPECTGIWWLQVD